MGSLRGPACRYPVALGDHVLRHANGIGEGGKPFRHRSLDVIQPRQVGVRRAVVYVVGGQNLVGYVEVARIEEVFDEA